MRESKRPTSAGLRGSSGSSVAIDVDAGSPCPSGANLATRRGWEDTQRRPPRRRAFVLLAAAIALAGCGGGGGSGAPATGQPPVVAPPPVSASGKFATEQSTSRFLTMATFGPKPEDVAALTGTSASAWIRSQFAEPASTYLPAVQQYYDMGSPDQGMLADAFDQGATTWVFWRNAVEGDDQLRQRMVFALSQILVISNGSGGLLGIFPQTAGYYQEILAEHAFGNYRDLLEAVTYSPAMAEYLTYLGNEKGDPVTGRVPDENYAREILQLFTVGLVQLNADGTVVTDAQGDPVEIYDNTDITELAKVFTGLSDPRLDLEQNLVGRIAQITRAVAQPLSMNDSTHSPEAKAFLGVTIPQDTPGEASIRLALDHIMAHPNVGPFVGRQLIQRFVTSNPSPAYVARVSAAFDQGQYTLPDGTVVGLGRKGDLRATIAAVLFDSETDSDTALADDEFGKVREPVLRLTHFMRAFGANMDHPQYVRALYDTSPLSVLGQHPFRSPSVFNFYRPGYVAPGSLSGDRGLVAPELQIVNASSIPGYINLLSYAAFNQQRARSDDMRPVFTRFGVPFDPEIAQRTLIADYTNALALVDDSEALVAYLDDLLLYGTMTEESRAALVATLDLYPREALQAEEGREEMVGYAVLLIMSSPDYLVQR